MQLFAGMKAVYSIPHPAILGGVRLAALRNTLVSPIASVPLPPSDSLPIHLYLSCTRLQPACLHTPCTVRAGFPCTPVYPREMPSKTAIGAIHCTANLIPTCLLPSHSPFFHL